MGCNKNLTKDQLEAMFTATDEEIQKIEQSMECLMERTKHKCKSCTRFFPKRSYAQAASLWSSNQKGKIPPLQ